MAHAHHEACVARAVLSDAIGAVVLGGDTRWDSRGNARGKGGRGTDRGSLSNVTPGLDVLW